MRAIVLNRYRQGESSLILKLFTEELGLISSYMPGGLKKKEIPEIGDLIECVPRRRSSEGLFSLYQASIHYKFHFPAHIELQVMRDILFEILWKTLPEEDPQEEMFKVVERYLEYVDAPKRTVDESFFALWLALLRYTEMGGFGLCFEACTRCGGEGKRGAILFDGLVCQQCDVSLAPLPPTLGSLLNGARASAVIGSYTTRDRLIVTRQMVGYIQEHMGFHGQLQSLQFLSQILDHPID